MPHKLAIQWKPDFRPTSGMSSSISWERMYPHLAKEINLKDDERITGIVVDENGIQCCIDKK